ncbi:MAG: serine/threonine-protein kinase [Desulfomonilaceae bacterium]|nr:serine/threonine-protein kinase [Desulfomonilaceae bacterium]
MRSILQESKGVPSIGRYQILDTLGRGNMGEVFRARDPMIGRLVALKTRRFDLVYEKKDLKFIIDKFFEEARIAGNLIHPHIVTVFDVGQDGDYCFIAMELLDGKNLTSYNKADTLLSHTKVMNLVRQTCVALDFAHSRKVIHRDIKPANLMFTGDDRIKITDFGIAVLTRSTTSDLQVMGTPSYMSPEQTKGVKLTPQTDFFSLGVVFFELLVGRRPFMGRTLYELMENIRYAPAPSLLTFNPKLPPSLDRIIQKALEKEPELRYRNGREFAADIDQVLQGKSVQVRDIKATRKADLLKPIEFFHSFSRKEIVEITRYGTFIRYDKSQVIVREGDVDTTFFILLYGRVRVIKNNRSIADLTKGACFGEMGAINKTPRTAHVIAKEPCLVLKLDFKVLERESPDLKVKFYHVFIQTLVQRLEATTKQLSSYGGSKTTAQPSAETQSEDGSKPLPSAEKTV